jgi:regulator of sigma E protease
LDQSQKPDSHDPLTPERDPHYPPPPDSSGGSPPSQEEAPAPPLTPMGWFAQNGPYLLLLAVAAILLIRQVGPESIFTLVKTAFGLGFLIFIHELGHFLTAKWCDVHVQTFSIGFGPAIPGCSFRYGETLYKIALLPLGGYVSMVGEGPEADEDENYPRSFKNKTVAQRMLIISAGVIMNILFGLVVFVGVYLFNGEERPPAIVWRTEAGSRAWEKGVRAGWMIEEIDGRKTSWFDDMKVAVALSRANSDLIFQFRDRENQSHEVSIEPRSSENDPMPVIGVVTAIELNLPRKPVKRGPDDAPAFKGSPAAAARAFRLEPGDKVVACSKKDGDKVSIEPVKPEKGETALSVVCDRMMALVGQPMTIRVERDGKTKDVEAETGFDFGDWIIGTTDPAHPEEPFRTTELRRDNRPFPENVKPAPPWRRDPFEFRQRMSALAGKPAVIQVLREGEKEPQAEPVNILVPPAFRFRLGARMKMGKVAAVREVSPAKTAGVLKGDTIDKVVVQYADGPKESLSNEEMDPTRLPEALIRRVATKEPLPADGKTPGESKWRIFLTVLRLENHNQMVPVELPPMTWDPDWPVDGEEPQGESAPVSIAQLGVAYWVESTVRQVEPGSPVAKAAVKAVPETGAFDWLWRWLGFASKPPADDTPIPDGLQENDEVREIRFLERPKKPGTEESWSRWVRIASKRKNTEVFDQWGHYEWAIQLPGDAPTLGLKIKRNSKEFEIPSVTAVADRSSPMTERGLLLQTDRRRVQARSVLEAMQMGIGRTFSDVQRVYSNLTSLLNGRVSPKLLGGPIAIATQTFSVADYDSTALILWLGMISINLAVVNFLPIPLLDGGHMVLLVYEGLRGKPPPEMVRTIAFFTGLACILMLMVFVFYNDIRKLIFGA